MSNLKLINSPFTTEERLQARINALRTELFIGEGDLVYVDEVLRICYRYLCQFESEDIYISTIKLKESIFYIDHFINS